MKKTPDPLNPAIHGLDRAVRNDVAVFLFVPPGEAHAEYNGPQRTVGVILRSRRLGNFPQNWFDPETGAIQKHLGPEQVPYELS